MTRGRDANRAVKVGLVQILLGLLLIIGAVEWAVHGSDHRIAGFALGLAAIALIWTIFLSATLENVVRSIAADVRRIADSVAPPAEPERTEPVAQPERTDPAAED